MFVSLGWEAAVL